MIREFYRRRDLRVFLLSTTFFFDLTAFPELALIAGVFRAPTLVNEAPMNLSAGRAPSMKAKT